MSTLKPVNKSKLGGLENGAIGIVDPKPKPELELDEEVLDI
jgi:hypothetical protein